MKKIIRISFFLVFVLSTNLCIRANKSINTVDNIYYQDTLKNKQSIPKMELVLGDVSNGQKIDRSNLTLNLRVIVGEISPKIVSAKVEKWLVSIDGCDSPFSGTGNTLSKEVIKEIKQAKEGSKITISVIYERTDATTIKTTTSTFLANPKTSKN